MAGNKDVLKALKSREKPKKSLFIPLKCALFECVMSHMKIYAQQPGSALYSFAVPCEPIGLNICMHDTTFKPLHHHQSSTGEYSCLH